MKNTLDSSAHMFASNRSMKNSATFRISAVLKDPVEAEILQEALNETVLRYPMMLKKLKKGLFWYYFDENDNQLRVKEECEYPAKMLDPDTNGGYMIKVLYWGCRVSIETFHVITDGTGAAEFLKTLLYHYIKLRYGVHIELDEKILLPDNMSIDESEDSFRKYFLDKEGREKDRGKKAYLLKGTPYSNFGNNVTTLVVSASDLNRIAKSYGATITGFLTSLIIESINEQENDCKRRDRNIVIQLPVNIRKFFPSRTLRNFFGVVNISEPFWCGERDRKELVSDVAKKLSAELTAERLTQLLKSNVALSTNFFSRITPLRLKNLFIPLGAKNMGEAKKTVAMSNCGIVRIPTDMREYIDVFEMILYPTAKGPANVGVISYEDRLTISIARNIMEKDVVRTFARKLSALTGTACYSNSWGTHDEEM